MDSLRPFPLETLNFRVTGRQFEVVLAHVFSGFGGVAIDAQHDHRDDRMAILYPEAYDRRSYLGLTDKSLKLIPSFQGEGRKTVSLLLEGAEITDLEIRLRNSHSSITVIDVLVASIRLSRRTDGKIFYYNTKASSVGDDITAIIADGMYDVISYEIIVLTTCAWRCIFIGCFFW